MATRRQYSDNDKATILAALDANGGDLLRTARETGVPRSTLRRWAQGSGVNQETQADLRHQKKHDLALELEAIAYQLAGAIPDKIDAANLQQTATSLGIVIDKMQLLRGKPTSITDDASLTDDQRVTRIATLFDKARARRDGQAAGGDETPVP